MKNLINGSRIAVPALTVLVVGVMSAQASIDLTITDASTLSATDVGLTAPNGTPVSSVYIGEYGFEVGAIDPATAQQTGLTMGSTFNSVCLSPLGSINASQQYEFNYQSFSEAAPGLNPSGYWSVNGIQNAAYLWNVFGGQVSTGAQGAGLALAMLEVLYNGGSTYGSLTLAPNANTQYSPNFNGDTAVQSAYNTYIGYYEANGGSSGSLGEAANTQTYGIFVPTADSGAGQEFIFISPNGMNGGPVPESPTVIAGALLVLPFGASALRVLRAKNRASA